MKNYWSKYVIHMARICKIDMILIKNMFQILATWLQFSTEEYSLNPSKLAKHAHQYSSRYGCLWLLCQNMLGSGRAKRFPTSSCPVRHGHKLCPHTTSPYSWNRKHVIWRSHLSGEAHSSQDHSVFIPNHALPISSHPTQKLRAKSLP